MPDIITIDFEIRCNIHNNVTLFSSQYRQADSRIDVNPCPDCIKEAEQKGYDDGYSEGTKEREE